MKRTLIVLTLLSGLMGVAVVAQQQKDREPKQADLGLKEDDGLESSAITYLEVAGQNVEVHPSKVSFSYRSSQPFLYIRPVTLARTNGKAYNEATGQISFNIKLEQPTDEGLLAAAGRVLNNFDPDQRKGVLAKDVLLNAAPLTGYEIRLTVGGREVLLERKDTLLSGTNLLKIDLPVTDEAIKTLLKLNPSQGTIEFYGLYKIRQAVRDEVRAGQSVKAVTEAFEKVLGKNPDPVYYVQRNVLSQLKTALSTTIVGEFRTSDFSHVTQLQSLVQKSLDAMQPASLKELRETDSKIIAYGPDQLRVDIAPGQINNLITNATTYDKLYDTMSKSWDKFYEEVMHETDEQAYFNKVSNYIETEKNGGGSVGGSYLFGFIKGQASGSGSFWKKEGNEKISTEKRLQVKDFMKRAKEVYDEKQTHYKEFFQAFTGKKSDDHTEVKNLDLIRVDQWEISQSLNVVFGIVVNKGTITRPYLTRMSLAGNDFLTDEQRFDKMLAAGGNDWKHFSGAFVVTNNLPVMNSFPGFVNQKPGNLITPVLVVQKNGQGYYTASKSLDPQPYSYNQALPLLPYDFGTEVVAAWLTPTDIVTPLTLHGATLDPFISCVVFPGGPKKEKNQITFSIRSDDDKPKGGYFVLNVIYRGPEVKMPVPVK